MLLHICNNFISSKVHANLIRSIAGAIGLQQFVFVPIRTELHRGLFGFALPNVEITYKKCQGRVLRFFPLLKILVTLVAFLRSTRDKKLNGARVLAHTLWSDGCVAYFNKVITGVPYSVVIRNTDINWFVPKLPHYRWLIARILGSAEAVVFVSLAHRRRFEKTYPDLYAAAGSIEVIPNGVEEFWLENLVGSQIVRGPVVTFVGRFDRNKNLGGLIEAVQLVRKQILNLKLVLIGGSSKELSTLLSEPHIPAWVECLGKVTDMHEIRDRYRETKVFALTSHTETFGLVYIEAMSQGCPFVYTENEGVDGFFDDAAFCTAVNPSCPEEISNGIVDLMRRYPDGIEIDDVRARMHEFKWTSIAERYLTILRLGSARESL